MKGSNRELSMGVKRKVFCAYQVGLQASREAHSRVFTIQRLRGLLRDDLPSAPVTGTLFFLVFVK